MQILILSFSRWMGSSCVGSAHCHIVVFYRKRKSSGKALVPPTLTPLPSVRRNIRDTIIIISTTTDMEVRITSKQYNNIIHILTSINVHQHPVTRIQTCLLKILTKMLSCVCVLQNKWYFKSRAGSGTVEAEVRCVFFTCILEACRLYSTTV